MLVRVDAFLKISIVTRGIFAISQDYRGIFAKIPLNICRHNNQRSEL